MKQYYTKSKCQFFMCRQPNPNQNNEQLKQPFKKQKISLKKIKQLNVQTERDSELGSKKIWQQKTRSGTYRPSGLRAKNTKMIQIENCIFKKRENIINSITSPNNSTRTSHIPHYRNTSELLRQINPQPYGLKSLTERNSVLNINTEPQFQSPTQSLKDLRLMVQKANINSRFPTKSALIKQDKYSDFQNQYETVNSVFSSSTIQQRESQSIIQIDFFNPSQKRLDNIQRCINTQINLDKWK